MSKSRDILTLSSYGGHYGPGQSPSWQAWNLYNSYANHSTAFYHYFEGQNELIKNGSIGGTPLNLKTLGIGNGIIDAATQFPFVSQATRRGILGTCC